MWLFRKTHESLRSIWEAIVINLSLLFLLASRSVTLFSLSAPLKTVLFYRLLVFFFLFFIFLLSQDYPDYFVQFYIFFLNNLVNFVLCLLLSAGLLFTPLCPDSLQTPQFTLCGKQDRTLSVTAFCPAGTGTDQRPKPSDNKQQTGNRASSISKHIV